MGMLTEAEPHIRRISSGEGWAETRSPNCPEELNPFGKIPVENQLISQDIARLRTSFLKEVEDNTGKNRTTPEGDVSVHNDPGKPLLIEIQFHHPPEEDRGEFARRLIHRFKLYGNDVGVKQVVDLSIVTKGIPKKGIAINETILFQEFVTANHLPSLNYALMVLQQHH